MTRWLGWLCGGLLLGAVAHLMTVLWLPTTATRDSFARLTPTTPINRVMLLAQPGPTEPLLPFLDPAFATAICRYDLSDGSLKVRMPVTQTYGSMTFYTRAGTAFYALNDRAAGRRMIELDLMTAAQRSALDVDEEVTSADRLIVETPGPTGLIVMRALAAEPGAMPTARGVLSAAECRIQPPQG